MGRGYSPNPPGPGAIVITNPAEIQNIEELVSESARNELHQIDFPNRIAIYVYQGQQPTIEYGVRVQEIYTEVSHLIVHACFVDPENEGISKLIQYYHIHNELVTLERSDPLWDVVVLAWEK